MKRIILVIFFLAKSFLAFGQTDALDNSALAFFYSPSCKECLEIKNDFLPGLEKEFAGRLVIEYRDISDINNYKILLSLREKYGLKSRQVVPVFYFRERLIEGQGDFKNTLFSLLAENQAGAQKISLPAVDLIRLFKEIKPLTVIGAGLIDGINPCAFTVIVFFISFLALQGYRKRELLVIGLTFIFAVFLTYLLLGLGVFAFLYRLKNFWLAVRIFNLALGVFCIGLGALAIYDYFKFKKTKEADGMVLQLPVAIKNQIHRIIGSHYRKGKEAPRRIFGLTMSALVSGFLVSLLEAVCTGQVYLPTIAFVLKTTSLKLPAVGYLVLYNLMFIVPLLAIFCFALGGVTSGQFARFLKQNMAAIKIAMALLFFILGTFLFLEARPQQALIEKYPVEVSDSLEKDFGKVKEGAVLRHTFIFKNQSKKPLNIKDVNTSCGCTVSEVKKKALASGESTEVKVEFRTKGYAGVTQQFVYLYTDSLDNPVVRFIIKAEIIK